MVDTGLLRENEARDVSKTLTESGVNLIVVDAGKRFLTALEGVTDKEKKRKIIGKAQTIYVIS